MSLGRVALAAVLLGLIGQAVDATSYRYIGNCNGRFVGRIYSYKIGRYSNQIYLRMTSSLDNMLQYCTYGGVYRDGGVIMTSNPLFQDVLTAAMYTADESLCATMQIDFGSTYSGGLQYFSPLRSFSVLGQESDQQETTTCPEFDPQLYEDASTWLAKRRAASKQ